MSRDVNRGRTRLIESKFFLGLKDGPVWGGSHQKEMKSGSAQAAYNIH